MKVIDLYNKMYNKEPLPNTIRLPLVNGIESSNCVYTFSPFLETYANEDGGLLENATCFATLLDLEIVIENKEDEQLVNDFGFIYETDNEKINTNFENIRTTLYNIINEINKLKIEKETEK